ncbi:unnamed protein product [marine sediment metagenome]|uniref:Uncharacterized protein n=1 Tax=marine sediment metagenome TaxID=412755 RepID=X1H6T8_9ZZZZ
MSLTLIKLRIIKNTQNPIAINLICQLVIFGFIKVANAPMPTNANALLRLSENQLANPPIVPAAEPILRSIKK